MIFYGIQEHVLFFYISIFETVYSLKSHCYYTILKYFYIGTLVILLLIILILVQLLI